MTLKDTTSVDHIQPVRRVNENEQLNSGSATINIIHLTCYPDPSTGKDILLWDDILAAFKENVVHVRSGVRVLPFLKGSDFKNLEPLRIAAVPGATLDVVVRGPLSPANELSLEPLQRALPDTPPKGNNSSSTLVSNTPTRAATTVKRNPVGGLVEEAMQNYNHIDNPATLPPRRGPQTILEERAASKENGTDIHNPPTTTISSDSNNSDSRLGAPQEPTPTSTPDFAETIMKASLGDKDAQYAVGHSYYFGRGVQQDYQAAAYWSLKAAEQGHATAQYNIGYLYQKGLGVPKDYSRAMEWYQKAAEQGDATAQSNIGVMYLNGFGISKDYSRAREWLQKAAEQGHATAQSHIGVLYQNGLGVPKDYSRAMDWYLRAAEQGYAEAQSNIGVLYQNGLGVPKDYSRAMDWHLKAAEQGHADAQNDIGYLYQRSQGVAQDYSRAMDWYLRAAEQGHAAAQYNIGAMYQNGSGISKDSSRAMEWFQKAAEQGNAVAQFSIGVLYEYGQSVQKDKSKAMEWYKKAADGGCIEAKGRLDESELQGDDSVGYSAKKKKRSLFNRMFN